MNKASFEELQTALSTDGIDNRPVKEEDFRKLSIIYLCEGNGNEELCKRFSPGPSGKCSHQDFSNIKVVCLNKEE